MLLALLAKFKDQPARCEQEKISDDHSPDERAPCRGSIEEADYNTRLKLSDVLGTSRTVTIGKRTVSVLKLDSHQESKLNLIGQLNL